MTKVIRSCDFSATIATKIFVALNDGKVKLVHSKGYPGIALITKTKPTELIYPEGWYYAKGTFRNKHRSTSGVYEEVKMFKDLNMNKPWEHKWCTWNDEEFINCLSSFR